MLFKKRFDKLNTFKLTKIYIEVEHSNVPTTTLTMNLGSTFAVFLFTAIIKAITSQGTIGRFYILNNDLTLYITYVSLKNGETSLLLYFRGK